MGSPVQRKAGVLTYPGTSNVPRPTARDVWPLCPMTNDSFYVMVDMPLGATIAFEIVNEVEHHIYQNLFEDHSGGEGIAMDSWSILRMSIERADVPWSDLGFKSKTQSHQPYHAWVKKIVPILRVSTRTLKLWAKNALDCFWLLPVTWQHQDLDLGFHGGAWRAFSFLHRGRAHIRGHGSLTMLPIYGKGTRWACFSNEKMKRSCDFYSGMATFKTFCKSTYNTWLRYFNGGEGSQSGPLLEALLSYGLSLFVLPSCVEDGLIDYVFPPAIVLAKGNRLVLLFKGS